MFYAESVEEAWGYIEPQFDKSDNFTIDGEINLSERVVTRRRVKQLGERCCGTDEALFVIDGDLWLLAWSYGH